MTATASHESQLGNPTGQAELTSYLMFGLRVVSEFDLPVPKSLDQYSDSDMRFITGTPTETVAVPAVAPTSEFRCGCAQHNGAVVLRIHREDGHSWVWRDSVGTCHVSPDGRTVSFISDPDVAVDQRLLGFFLAGLVATFALHQRGLACLHASAIRTDCGAIAFLGPKGQGKSTMAAGFLKGGATLLTDDILPLQASDDGVYGLPGVPIMKLWDESVEHALSVDDKLPNIHDLLEKKLFTLDERFAFATHPSRLQAMYILDRFDPAERGNADITIRRVSQREGLIALVAQASLQPYVSATDIATLLPVLAKVASQAPLRVVNYPNGFAHQATVQQHILEDAVTS